MYRLFWRADGVVDPALLALLHMEGKELGPDEDPPEVGWKIEFEHALVDDQDGDARGVAATMYKAVAGAYWQLGGAVEDIDILHAWVNLERDPEIPQEVLQTTTRLVSDIARVNSTLGEWVGEEMTAVSLYFVHVSVFEALAEVDP